MALKKPAPKAATKATVPAKPVTAAPAQAKAQRPAYVQQESFDIPADEQFQPELKIVQSISNERIKGDPAYIEGAEDGMLFNSSTKELFDGAEGIEVVPIGVTKTWTEWVPRSKGGGFVASYSNREDMERSRKPENEVNVDICFTVLMAESEEQVKVRFNTASKYPVARQWGQLINEAGSLCGKKYLITTEARRNKQNQNYYAFRITDAGWVSKQLYDVAHPMTQSFKALPAPEHEGDM